MDRIWKARGQTKIAVSLWDKEIINSTSSNSTPLTISSPLRIQAF
jgi:hypothetical protein